MFDKRMFFLPCFWRFLSSNKLEKLEFKLEKLVGFRQTKEKEKKLEKTLFVHLRWQDAILFSFYGAKVDKNWNLPCTTTTEVVKIERLKSLFLILLQVYLQGHLILIYAV